MGCGKSKLDAVAAGNILSRKKSSVAGSTNAPDIVKEETFTTANDINKAAPVGDHRATAPLTAAAAGRTSHNVGPASPDVINAIVEEVDNVVTGVEKDDKEKNLGGGGDQKQPQVAVPVAEGERLGAKDSPDEYFSSVKDHHHRREDSQGDNKSEYSSPTSKESPFHDHPQLNSDDVSGTNNIVASPADRPADGTITTDATATLVQAKETNPSALDGPNAGVSGTDRNDADQA